MTTLQSLKLAETSEPEIKPLPCGYQINMSREGRKQIIRESLKERKMSSELRSKIEALQIELINEISQNVSYPGIQKRAYIERLMETSTCLTRLLIEDSNLLL